MFGAYKRKKPFKNARAKKAKTTTVAKKTTYRAPVYASMPRFGPRAGPASRMYNTFIYSERFSLAAGAAVAQNYQFALSSIHDPNITAVGTQPVNYDQYAAMFEKYLVYEVEVHAECAANVTNIVLVGVTVTDENITPSDPKRLIENGQCDWHVLEPQGGTDRAVFKMTVDNAKVHGVTRKSYFADDAYRAQFGANPAEGLFLNCWISSIDPLGSTTASQWHIELRYKTLCMGGKINVVS